MTRGKVVGNQARVNVTFRLPDRADITIEFIVDTGFEGALTLPIEAVETLGLPIFGDISANLADDTDVEVDVYSATILWEGRVFRAAVLAMGRRPLLGTALLENRHLSADFIENGEIVIEDV